jgi:hypothetical protein
LSVKLWQCPTSHGLLSLVMGNSPAKPMNSMVSDFRSYILLFVVMRHLFRGMLERKEF